MARRHHHPRPALSDKRQRFVREYCKDFNAAAAIVRAGYATTDHTRKIRGSQLLAVPAVQEAIAAYQARARAKTEMTCDEWRSILVRVARGDVRNVVDRETGHLVPPHQLDDDGAAVVAGIEVARQKTTVIPGKAAESGMTTIEESVVKVKLIDRLKALELLGKHLGLLKESVDLKLLAPLFALPPGTHVDVGGTEPPDLLALPENGGSGGGGTTP